MDIKSFEVWNFKSIEYSGEISFPKLTVLIGQNSAGKSSIAQSLLLMKQTFEAEEPSIPLVLNGPYTQLGEYKDFIHGKDDSLPFIIKFNCYYSALLSFHPTHLVSPVMKPKHPFIHNR